MYLANYDQNGIYLGFYLTDIHGDKIPSPTIALSEQKWQEALTGEYKVIGGKHTYVGLPEPTPEEIKAQITDAIQHRLDSFAQIRHYDDIFTAATYATSSVPLWQMEGQYAVNARDATWAKAYEILMAVESGAREIPTIEEVFAELPELKWPDDTSK